MSKFTLDWPHGWQTQEGRAVEIYSTDVPGVWPIHGRIHGESFPSAWRADGSYLFPEQARSVRDLVNRQVPNIRLPMRKLHSSAISAFSGGSYFYIPISNSERPKIGAEVKWFYADEMENVK